MAELAMLADIQRMVYPEEVTRHLHVMAQDRENLPVIDPHSNHCLTFADSNWMSFHTTDLAILLL